MRREEIRWLSTTTEPIEKLATLICQEINGKEIQSHETESLRKFRYAHIDKTTKQQNNKTTNA